MFGFPYFHIISSILLNKQKVIIAAHNVNTPKGAVNYHYAKAYCDNKEKANYFELSACEVEGVYQNVKRHIKVFNME